jgi:ABC-type transport system involved in cytochrome bd biosynthesis fused ATPase/permease subunit
VLLDEPTAHLDPATEAQVYASLFAQFQHACFISSVHRLQLLDQFDEVLFMRGGRLIAQASPGALAAGCPEFQDWIGPRHGAADSREGAAA